MIPVISEVRPGLSRPDTFTSTSSLTLCILPALRFFLGSRRRRNHINTIHTLQAPGQLMTTTAPFTQVVFKIAKAQAQLAFTRFHFQLILFTEHGDSNHVFFAILHPGGGNADDLVTFTLG